MRIEAPSIDENLLRAIQNLASIELTFQENKIPHGSTINDLTESQQLVLRAIADSTSTGLEMLYRNSTLDFMGIRAVSPAHGSSAREKLIEFLNGEKLRYDT